LELDKPRTTRMAAIMAMRVWGVQCVRAAVSAAKRCVAASTAAL
jgi:hypothetical protein